MSEAMLLVRGADVFDPAPIGRHDLLLAGGRIVAMAPRLSPGADLPVRVLEAAGRIAVPGLVDSLVHVSGGGGEGGFQTRTPALLPAQALASGVTTFIGALGTDDATRSHADLLACCRALGAYGLTAHALTGSYRVPVRTLTGSVRDDLVLVPDIIGVGEIAIADHRGSQPSADELARIASDARVGGMLSGKAGTVLVHVGDAPEGLALLHAVSDRYPVPATQWHPTHINRHAGLLAQAAAWVARGGSVDITTSTSAELLQAGEVAAAQALVQLLASGLPVSRISLSSDGQASLPDFDAQGRLRGMEVADVGSLLRSLAQAVTRHGLPLAAALPAATSTPADIWGLRGKGRLAVGADADLLLLAPGTLALEAVVASGQLRWGG
ncbi:MAG: beta-aspartyl-peptidase [Arenimonas sp.]|uniref:beta-aspartyl-peptidase n=1 Tax=Arenimonas sp. TaxID=1872635 RepID=UPI0025C1BD28|nr:beta-aspartyl-peptidase [Arenimonas sp.]MBW8366674.1 beta-aspartyl-peptidase [Arenimonas sp.]